MFSFYWVIQQPPPPKSSHIAVPAFAGVSCLTISAGVLLSNACVCRGHPFHYFCWGHVVVLPALAGVSCLTRRTMSATLSDSASISKGGLDHAFWRWGEGLKTMKMIDQTFQVIPQSSSVTSKTQRKNCPTMIPGSYPNTSQNHPNRSQRAPKRHLKGTLGEALDPKPTNTAHLPFSDFFCHPKGAQRSP